MIQGSFLLVLHCRYENCVPGVVNERSGASITGASEEDCRHAAKGQGWTFDYDGDVTCPLCNYRLRNQGK